jgi:RNA polymerase sigma-70 factor (ECF subfamily)
MLHLKPTPMDERALLRRAQTKEPAAQAELLRRYGPRLYGLCRRLSQEPDDAYQEIWAKIFTRLDRFDADAEGSFAGWTATLAHRHLIDEHRRGAKQRDVIPLPDLGDDRPGQDELAQRRDEAARLDSALRLLPVEQRRVVLMHHGEGHSVEEIAASEGVPEGTIKSRLHRARARLMSRLRGSP